MDLEAAAVGLVPISMIVAGAVLLWGAGLSRLRSSDGVSPLLISMRVSGWALLLVGIFAIVAIMTHVLVLVGWVATAIIFAAAAHQYYEAERQSLIWVLTTSAERGLPLDAAARAFAADRNDRVGRKAARLADYLEAGIPLSLAFERSGNSVSPETRLAASLGQHTGTLGTALRQVASHTAIFEKTLRSTAHWIFYFAFLVVYILFVLTFAMTKIFPVVQMINRSFETPLPRESQLLVTIINYVTEGWFLTALLLIGLFFLFGLVLAHYVGFSVRQVPVLRRLWWRVDCALVMRWLANAVRRNRPVPEMVQLLAGYFPQPTIRRRLERVAKHIDRGGDWCESLRQAGLIRRAESVLFKTAERTGNLSWALDEMADSAVRRSAYRLRVSMDLAFPLVLLVIGGAELFLAVALLMPVFSLFGVVA